MQKQEVHVKSLLDRILALEQLTVLFQPIVVLDKQSIFGYEGLIRGPSESLLHRPNVLFAAAAKYERLMDLDFLCRKLIIRQFAKLGLSGQLFVNINPVTLTDDEFIHGRTLMYLQNHKLDPDRVVVEITETQPIQDWTVFQQALQHYRGMGFKVALDDLGAGHSSLKLWSELNPDFVKIDRHFIEGVDEDQTKRQFIKSIIEIAKSLGCQTITEGIEHKHEYAALRKLGINMAQGFYFSPPKKTPDITLNQQLFSDRQKRSVYSDKLTVAHLLKEIPTVSPQSSMEEVGEIFRISETLQSVAVVDNDEPLGLVLRNDLMNLLASRYGRDLHGRKPIQEFVLRPTLKFDLHTSLEDASRCLTSAVNHQTDEFIITDNGHLVGKGTLLDLLSTITDLQITKARHANPLTLLPGNVLIQQKLDEFLRNREDFIVAYCDLDHFKAYNDVYSYIRGDDLIQLVGRLLMEITDPDLDFVGHIGGDDFIVLFRNTDWRERCQQLLQTFESLVPDYYTAKDRQVGGIEASDRYGEKRYFPFVSLSIGILPVAATQNGLTKEVIAEMASIAKKKAKGYCGNAIYVENTEGEKETGKDSPQDEIAIQSESFIH
ncbi:bifunctional diguanylate cyclase/phosphodiesterase [Methylocaldum sp.]|uniref:GGDEF domain-containing protein n=1 Tax=Methylocaldum sp. TaxID=1969727 RepID=UPI002D3723A5|nr:bifunctional diguanylate cyclase/phosphodiesterase [Methylocaldum sp.]HYE36989.1 bifunctional diguanylate cyclase/phosphodiesterase [Methylocaldum sp.]